MLVKLRGEFTVKHNGNEHLPSKMNHNGKVLVVDDEQNALRVLSAILSDAGYHVLE